MRSSPRAYKNALLLTGLRGWASVSVVALCISFQAWCQAPQNQGRKAAIEPEAIRKADLAGFTTFWLVFKDQADLRPAAQVRNWKDKGQFVYSRLREASDKSQTGLSRALNQRGISTRSFWIINAMAVTGDRALIQELASLPDVQEIRADRLYHVPEDVSAIPSPATNGIGWNIGRVQAPTVWNNYGTRGEGIVVCNIDTGVEYTHPALVAQYRGNNGAGNFTHDYNWFDPAHGPAPYDSHWHGTHTMGTMIGDDGLNNKIGVAPGAKWIAAKGCAGGSCSGVDLVACAQWVLAPTDLKGENPRPDLRPNIVNNSWGGDFGGDPWFQWFVQQWIAAGIFPVFSAGNFGDSCWTASSPGDYPESYAVGAFDYDNNLAYFSASGPSYFGGIKPDISAPGFNIRSSVPSALGSLYGIASGTSMAAPHVAASVALLWSAAPALKGDIAATRAQLALGAIKVSDNRCGGTLTNNNMWGEGRLDASMTISLAPRGPTGTLDGLVTAAGSGTTITNAMVHVTGPMTATASTDGTGAYSFPGLVIGTYDVAISAYGYVGQTNYAVAVSPGLTTTRSYELVPEPAVFSVSGTVMDSAGRPAAGAQVLILTSTGLPVAADVNGAFTIANVPQGAYTISAEGNKCLLPISQLLSVSADVSGLVLVLPKRVDEFGYECDVVSPSYVQATTALDLTGNDFFLGIPLPFAFEFYGRTYTNLTVTCNGFLTFIQDNASEWRNSQIPNPVPPNAAIYAFWDDLIIDATNRIYTSLSGVAPNRQFVVEWRQAYIVGGGLGIDVEAVLKENGEILMQYRNVPNNDLYRGGAATIGLENENGKIAFNFSSDSRAIDSPDYAIRFYHAPLVKIRGRVTDGNDKKPVARATVTITQAGRSRDIAADENGVYETRVPVGETQVEASSHNYITVSTALTLSDTNTTRIQDFALPSALVRVLPAAITLTLAPGQTRSVNFSLTNAGGADLKWSLAATPNNGILAQRIHNVFNAWADPNATSVRGLYLEESPANWPAMPGEVIRSFAPTGLLLGWGLGRITNLWVSDALAASDTNRSDLTEYSPIGSATGARWRVVTNGAWVADMAYDSTHKLMCAVTVGGTGTWSNSIACFDPATGDVVTHITGSWSAISQRGLAYRPDDDTFYVGSWNEAVSGTGITYIYKIKGLSYSTPGEIISSIRPLDPATSGLAWNPVEKVLWQSCQSFKDNLYALDPDSGAILLTLVSPNPNYNNQGLEIDEAGKLWLSTREPNVVYLIDAGIPTYSSMNWFSTSATNGTTPVGNFETIAATVDATGFAPGTTDGVVVLESNDGRGVLSKVPVRINVTDGNGVITGAALSSPKSNQAGWMGMKFTVGAKPLSVLSLGRMMAPRNSQAHQLKLVHAADGTDVTASLVTVSMAGGVAGQFKYATLPSPIVLEANATYYLVSEEFAGPSADDVYDQKGTSVATGDQISSVSAIESSGPGSWQTLGNTNHCYGPLDFRFVPCRSLLVDQLNTEAGATIALGPSDLIGANSGAGPLGRFFDDGTEVTVTAAKIAGTNVFEKWQKNGVDYSSSPTEQVTMGSDVRLTAVYKVPVVSGKVLTATGIPIPGATLTLAGDAAATTSSGSDGSYRFALFAGGNFTLSASSTTDSPANRGVTVTDIVMLQRHVLGMTSLGTPEQLLAADLNNSQSITVSDVVAMRRLVLGLVSEVPSGLWRVVPSGSYYDVPTSPWANSQIFTLGMIDSDRTSRNFSGLKMGDLNFSWTPPVAPGAAKIAKLNVESSVRVKAGSIAGFKGQTVALPLRLSEVNELTGLQFTLAWDPSILRFLGTSPVALPGNSQEDIGTKFVADGLLTFAWIYPWGAPAQDETTLLTVFFKVVGPAGASSLIQFPQTPTPLEATVGLEATDPLVETGRAVVLESAPRLLSSIGPNGVSLAFESEANVSYTLESSESAESLSWSPIHVLRGDGKTRTIVEPFSAKMKFYRLRLD